MPFLFRTVDRALQAPQQCIVDCVLLGLIVHFRQQSLHFEAVFQALDFQAQRDYEFGQRLELARIGRLMHAAEEVQAGFGQCFGHRFVGGQHKGFDDLMALGVFGDVRADHLSVAIQVDFDFRHGQLERATFKAPRSQHCRQLAHVAE